MKHQQLKIVLFCPILITKQNHCKSTTEGPRIVQILCFQGIVLLQNHTKRGFVLNVFFAKKGQKIVLYWGIHTVPGIVLSGKFLNGDPL